jgi:energy-coupling factor transporter ATP-binding protein EcfA2
MEDGDVLLTDRGIKKPVSPELYSSTGQLNVLALAVFLGIALRQRITKFDAVLLDEPVQNLDDIRFLSFMTLLKRVALRRQVVFSTADSNIAELFTRQMRSRAAGSTVDFVHHEWRDFDARRGPRVVTLTSETLRASA